ncbi:MAG: hypothetical protein ACP5PS_06975, partial [Bacteroidales bacterium]
INVNYNERSIFLGSEIVTQLFNTLNELIIEGPNELTVKLGQSIPTSSLTYAVKNSRGIPQKAIPLRINYFDRSANKSIITNNMGEASITIESIRSKKKSETIRVEVDFESIVKEATRDVTIGMTLARTRTPYIETYLTIIRPKFYINSDETNLDQILNERPLAEAIKRKLLEEGFPVTDRSEEADFKIYVKAGTFRSDQSQQYVQVALNLKLNVLNSEGNTIFSFASDKITASHFDASKAGMQAYAEVVKRIDSSVFNELLGRAVGYRLY